MVSKLSSIFLAAAVLGTAFLGAISSRTLLEEEGRLSRGPETLAIKASSPVDTERSGDLVRLLRHQLLRSEPWGPDRRLHRAAWTVLRYTEGLDGAQVDGVLEEAFDGEGVFDTLVFPVEAWSESLEDAILSISDALSGDLNSTSFNRLGIAAEKVQRGWRVLTLVANRRVEINAHARAIQPGGNFELRGLLTEAKSEAEVLVLSPDGRIFEVDTWIKGMTLGADIPLDKPGEYRIEVLLHDKDRSPEIPAALFTLHCGDKVPVASGGQGLPRFRLHPSGSVQGNLTHATTQEIWTRSDRLRAHRGLSHLNRDKKLERIAYKHARYLAEKRTLAHVDSSGRGPFERVRSGGIRASSIGENVAAGLSAEGIQTSLERSPSHLQQLLRSDVTRMGVGTAIRDGVVFVVQLFAGP